MGCQLKPGDYQTGRFTNREIGRRSSPNGIGALGHPGAYVSCRIAGSTSGCSSPPYAEISVLSKLDDRKSPVTVADHPSEASRGYSAGNPISPSQNPGGLEPSV